MARADLSNICKWPGVHTFCGYRSLHSGAERERHLEGMIL